MNKRLKKFIDENDFTKKFNIDEAVDLAINTATTKFDETIDICMNLNIDSKNGEQNVRGTITLPKGLGKKVKVCVFAKEDKQQEAKDAGLGRSRDRWWPGRVNGCGRNRTSGAPGSVG